MADGRQEIVTTDFLQTCKPEVVLAMNPLNTIEIQTDLKRPGMSPKLATM